MSYVSIDLTDLLIASLLVLANGGLSLLFGLGLAKKLIWSALRMTIQLLAIGFVLRWLFAMESPWLTLIAALAMVAVAGREIMARQDRRLSGLWAYGLGTSTMLAAAMVVTVFALTTQIRPDPWWDPQYAIPILGMILGNTMTGIALGLQTLTRGLERGRAGVEARLALGETRFGATRHVLRDALSSALIPVINGMAAAGIVSLPGMMTGQILAGVEPVEAVKYQILIMFLIAGGTAFGAIAAVLGGIMRLTDSRHRLRLDRLANPRS